MAEDRSRRTSVTELSREPDASVLVIYTGGTIGMKPTEDGYAPASNFLAEYLKGLPQCHIQGYDDLTLPLSRYGKLIRYHILEYDPLLDSCNMGMEDWLRIASDIESNYNKYDAFVVLHGTDTMAYTASALSFLCENLAKTVVVTGSQVPMSQTQSDGMSNFLGALTVAGHFNIPEVGLYFNNKLLRGNRCRKLDASGFEAFDSPNYPPLVSLGTSLTVYWHRVRSGSHASKFRVAKSMCRDVTTLRLFPGMTKSTVEHALAPPIKGVILETFGAGNGPDANKEFLRIVEEAHDRGVVIANCTQCIKGTVSASYRTGVVLRRAGVVPCLDMTTEAALTKLSYLLDRFSKQEDVEHYMLSNMRGEVTPEEKAHFSLMDNEFLRSIAEAMAKEGSQSVDAVTQQIVKALGPVLLCSAAAQGDLSMIDKLIASSVDPSSADYDNRSAMHLAAANGQLEAIKLLVGKGADVNALDRWMGTPLLDAIVFGHDDCAKFIRDHSGHAMKSELVSRLIGGAAEGDTQLVERLCRFSADPAWADYDNRTALHLACANGHETTALALITASAPLNATDRWGATPMDDAIRAGHEDIVAILREHGGFPGHGVHTPLKSHSYTEGQDDIVTLMSPVSVEALKQDAKGHPKGNKTVDAVPNYRPAFKKDGEPGRGFSYDVREELVSSCRRNGSNSARRINGPGNKAHGHEPSPPNKNKQQSALTARTRGGRGRPTIELPELSLRRKGL